MAGNRSDRDAITASGQSLRQEILTLGLRVPRVVLVFPGDVPNWTWYARVCLHLASQVWGGSGFTFVSHSAGVVDTTLLRAVRAYDPDYVLMLPTQLATHDCESAWSSIAAACGCYRQIKAPTPLTPGPADLPIRHWSGTAHGSLVSVTDLDDDAHDWNVTVGGPVADAGLLGLAVAARWGQRAEPTEASGPELDVAERRRIIRAVFSAEFPVTDCRPLTSYPTADDPLPSDFDRTRVALTDVARAGLGMKSTVVYGDSADDFSLATIIDRTYGCGMWLPSEWWADQNHRHTIEQVVHYPRNLHESGSNQVTSLSESPDRQSAFAEELRLTQPIFYSADGEQLVPGKVVDVTPPALLQFTSGTSRHLAIGDQFFGQSSVAVAIGHGGSADLATIPPLPVVTNTSLPSSRLSWQVDATLGGREFPSGRAIRSESLVSSHSDLDRYHTKIRIGRGNTISYEAQRFNFVPANPTPEQRLARPRLSFPSLWSWIEMRAALRDMTIQVSAAGRYSDVVATRLGGRSVLREVIGSGSLPALAAFLRSGASSDAYDPAHGCVVRNEGYLTFSGFAEFSEESREDVRRRVDQLITAGLLVRGLVLGCSSCSYVAFYPLSVLSADFTCQRCLDTNSLTQPRWRQPIDEPAWFYDLNPAFRFLIKENGQYPLVLANYLERNSSRQYADVVEFEVISEGKKQHETDLAAFADDELIVAEVKNANCIGSTSTERRAAARKRVRAAQMIEADQILLATTHDEWEQSSVAAIQAAIEEAQWNPSPPRLRVITKLGTDDAQCGE
ncbi:hypothetical protein AAFP30_28540 [Gordonia sp. CPCC 205515]|uniref:hypothetical protein n=1 Tax=Gordonia sp. CPCC 205515 TaxID=3140791 RepID=UPI003AF33620